MGNLCRNIHSKNQNNIKDKKKQDDPSIVQDVEEINRNSFNFLQIIGVGRVGKSWKAQCKKTKQIFAIKEINKSKVTEKNLLKRVIVERDIISKLHSPFLISLEYSFQDDENFYLVSEFLSCGDLKFHYEKNRKLSELQVKFIVICVILGLEYLFANNIIHLDIRPENILLDNRGYFRIINFFSARFKMEKEKNTINNNLSDNALYLGPEIIHGMTNSHYSDYYSLGITCYELMQGHKPYLANNFREVKEKIMIKQYEIKKEEIPKGWSLECADFINKLIQRKPMDRLGFNGIEEIKNHPWFTTVNWKDYYDKKIKPPFAIMNIDDSYSKILYSPEKKSVTRKSNVDNIVKHLNKSFNKDFLYYDKKSLNNLKNKSVSFYNPQTKKNYRPEWDIPSLKEFYESGDISARTINPIYKSSISNQNSFNDIKSIRSSGSRGMASVYSVKSNVINGTTIFNKKIVKSPEKGTRK